MTLTTTLLSSVNDNSSTVTISFDEMIEVSKEVVAFTFLQMVAEVNIVLNANSIKMISRLAVSLLLSLESPLWILSKFLILFRLK